MRYTELHFLQPTHLYLNSELITASKRSLIKQNTKQTSKGLSFQRNLFHWTSREEYRQFHLPLKEELSGWPKWKCWWTRRKDDICITIQSLSSSESSKSVLRTLDQLTLSRKMGGEGKKERDFPQSSLSEYVQDVAKHEMNWPLGSTCSKSSS